MTLREEVAALRAEIAALRDVFTLAYEAGRADALHLPPRVPKSPRRVEDLPARHLTVVPWLFAC